MRRGLVTGVEAQFHLGMGRNGEGKEGGGIGGAYYHLPSLGNDFVFAYQALAGIGFIVAEDVKLEIGYRFFTSNDQHMNGVTVQAPQFQCVEAGIRIEF